MHGKEYELPPVFKINALRMLTVGKAKEYFDMWEADRDPMDPGKSYEELLNKVKDYARRKKLDTSVQKSMTAGHDPLDIGEADFYGMYAVGKGKGKSK